MQMLIITMSVLYVCCLKNDETPPPCTLVCEQEETDSTAGFTNMFSWVNTWDGGTRPRCKQIRPAFQRRGERGKYFGFIISGVHYSQDVRGVLASAVWLSAWDSLRKKPLQVWATVRFVSCQFHKFSLTGKKALFWAVKFPWQILNAVWAEKLLNCISSYLLLPWHHCKSTDGRCADKIKKTEN